MYVSFKKNHFSNIFHKENCNFQSFSEWTTMREEILKKHLAEIDKIKRINNTVKIKKDLEDEERLLTFFENEENIELKIEEIQQRIKAMEIPPKLLKKKLKDDEEYVPPDVLKRRNNIS